MALEYSVERTCIRTVMKRKLRTTDTFDESNKNIKTETFNCIERLPTIDTSCRADNTTSNILRYMKKLISR